MTDITKIVSSLADRLPEMSPQEQREALVIIRRLKNTQSTTGKVKKVPTTDDELWDWIKDNTGYEIPRVAVCEDHTSPFEFMCDFFFERESALLLLSSREAGKTLAVAIIHYANAELKPGVESCTFGAIEDQAKNAYKHVKSFIYEKDNTTGKKRKLKPEIEDTLRSETRWLNGSEIKILVGSKSGVNSPHPQKVHADEIDIMEEDVWLESRNMSSSKTVNGKRYMAQDVATSTRKSMKGLMQMIINETKDAEKNGFKPSWKLYSHCIFENAQEVPFCRVTKKEDREKRLVQLGKDSCELCECNKIVKGEWAENVPRTLESVCKGKFFNSRGWMEHEDVKAKFTKNTPPLWVAQMECRRPMADGLYLPTWSRDRHTIKGYEPRPEYGLLWQSVDWGGTEASAVLWMQGPLHQAVEVKNNIGTVTIIPQGSYVCFKELYEAAMGATRLAAKVIRQEIQYKNQFPGWRIKARFADMAGKQQRLDWREHNPPLRTVWYISREVDPQIECLQALVSDNLHYVDSAGAPNLCDDYESWRQKDGKEVHDSSSHGPASSRYLLKNVTTIIHRYSKVNSISPEPVVAARESPGNFSGAQAQEGVGSTGEFESGHWLNSFGPPERGDPWRP